MTMNIFIGFGITVCIFFCVFFFYKYFHKIFLHLISNYKNHIHITYKGSLESLHLSGMNDKLFLISIFTMIISIMFFLFIIHNWIGFILGIFTGYFAPKIYIKILLNKRSQLFQKQLPDAIMLMANSMKAGNSLVQAIELVAYETESPISQEFHYVLQNHKMGKSIQNCLAEFDSTLKNNDLSMIITATLVSMQTGSNLAEMYEKLATTIRQRSTMQNKIKSLTSQGKMQGIVVGLLPVILLFIINLINPKTIYFFLNSFAGGILLSLGIILEVLGIVFIRKIVSIDI